MYRQTTCLTRVTVIAYNQSMENKEEWLDIAGYEGWYQVSNLGRIKRVRPGTNTYVGRILKPMTSHYKSINLCKNGVAETAQIHRLVAEAFLGPCPAGMIPAHLDGNRLDNLVENIWYRPKLRTETKNEEVIAIRRAYATGATVSELASRYALSPYWIRKILRREAFAQVKDGCNYEMPAGRITAPPLDHDTVRSIRNESALGFTAREIAEKHGLDMKRVSAIILRRNYKNID